MKRGTLSMVVGAVALVSAIGAAHARTWFPGRAHVLEWLAEHGLVAKPKPYAFVELSEPSFFLVTDGGAIQLLLVLAWVTAAMAIVLALLALWRREHNLYPSSGLVLAFLSVALFNLPVAVIAALGSGIMGTWLRGRGDV